MTDGQPVMITTKDLVAASAAGRYARVDKGIAELLLSDKDLSKLTNLDRDETMAFTLARIMFASIDAMKDIEAWKDYDPPGLEEVIDELYRTRESLGGARAEMIARANTVRISEVKEDEEKKRKGWWPFGR